jgi:hypothetical protein
MKLVLQKEHNQRFWNYILALQSKDWYTLILDEKVEKRCQKTT